MSGLPEIEQWVEDNIDLSIFEDAADAFETIDQTFVSSNRLPLTSILLDDLPSFMEFLEGSFEATVIEEDPIESGMVGLFG